MRNSIQAKLINARLIPKVSAATELADVFAGWLPNNGHPRGLIEGLAD